MVTKTKLGLLCAALMMILGTQGVDAQRLTKQEQTTPFNLSAKAPGDHKGFKKSVPFNEGNSMFGGKTPMSQAPLRADSRLTASATHPKSWYQAKTYTWTDASNVTHTANYTDEATNPYQIHGFLYDLYSNSSIPGIQYSGIKNETIYYRFPWCWYQDYPEEDGSYYIDEYNLYTMDLGWGIRGTQDNGGPIPVTTPVENGYTVCLVKVKDTYSNPHIYDLGKEELVAYMDTCIESVQLLTDGLRVDENGSQAGTVFNYSGTLNRFFFIGKGKNLESNTYKPTQGYEELASTTFSGTGTVVMPGPYWAGSVVYDSSSGGYYMPSNGGVGFVFPLFVSNASVRVVINTANNSYGSGYFKITTKNGSQTFASSRGTANTFTLSGTFNAGDVIQITGNNSYSPDMSSNGIQIIFNQTDVLYRPSYFVNSLGTTSILGASPFYDMFEEFSPTSTSSGAEITDFYPRMVQGDVYPIEHDCQGVIALKHFFSMSGNDGTESKSLSNLVLYIPDNRAVYADQNYNTSLPPTVGLYIIQLEASIAPDDAQKEHTFDVTVDWESNLDNITSTTVPQTYELHAYWTDPVTGVEKDSIIYTGPNTSYAYEVPQYMASYTIEYKVKATPTNATNPDEFYAWSNIDDVIVPGYDDFFMLDRDHYESDFVITSETNFYRNYLYPKNKDVGGFTPMAIENGMKHFILYRQSTDEGGEPVPAADLYFENANGKVYYKIEYRDENQHPINNTNN